MEEIKTGVFKVLENIPIYVIGDIHGDYQCLVHCLVDLCNVCSIGSIESDIKFDESKREILEWEKNNNSVVIFCGDLIHRKRFPDSVLDDECSDIFIIKTLLRLKKSAQENGGNIILISGNHEIMSIINPSDDSYTSKKNIEHNLKYFSQHNFVNNYISNSYAWIKLNDMMIAHGGLCSDYLKFLDQNNEFNLDNTKTNTKNKLPKIKLSGGDINSNTIGGNLNVIGGGLETLSKYTIMIGGNLYEFGDDIVEFVNDRYKSFFTDYSETKSKSDPIGFELFVFYNMDNKHAHNIFWCREWGYSGINCDQFDKVVEKIGCSKMIVAHCPQFLSEDKSKMINFECEYSDKPNEYTDTDDKNKTSNDIIQKFKIARVDLGMSRSFEYNKPDEFVKFLSYNHNRKMSVLKLSWDKSVSNYYFNYDCVVTKKISCLQYLLIKYGIKKKDWDDKGIKSDWLGFKYVDQLIETIDSNKNIQSNCTNLSNPNEVMLCLLYPTYINKPKLKSVDNFNDLF